jgi:HEAT repeat protein
MEHQDHFVRWESLRAQARLDGEYALPQLKAALDDPHPHVRNAARSSLRRYQVLNPTGH